ncbi:LacI family transcriptional regulator [Chitinophaga terrae (ex Kim and Jung 2007)]|uniref:LacI family DNA-binding transcriptional regulator n=1 Tax=Chitinophaga terrae (ex Kim and Jung 2007) TaxID=408074 RepID=UPI00277DF8EE|nr:substrate-binding domain-containing protein [Chitinophaga terrae (ex Kim and Jung 2007)]MDQ0109537.1 LacI family transcriptional regulator [Chitinophaga terrae (ex Kim and Jung 2007)]
MKKKVALKDIAKELGVSTALVSYVMNNQEVEKGVNKESAIKIREAAARLNYRPNQIAKSLKTNKTYTIGLVVADIAYRFTTGITRAIEAEAKKNKYTVIFGSSDEHKEKFQELVHVLINRQVDGLILVPVEHSEQEIEFLQKNDIPFVLIDRYFPGLDANLVAIDNYKAAYQCTMHLVKQGYKKPAFVNYKTKLFHLQERTRGYEQALKDSGIKTDPSRILEIREKHIEEDTKKGIKQLIAQGSDSVFFATDILAIQGLKNINAMKIMVPEQLGVVSFDESEAFELFSCPITHGRQPIEDIGKQAVSTLLDLVNNNKVKRKIILESDFVKGKSCGE